MLNSAFSGLFDSNTISVIPVGTFLLCLGCALALGLLLAFACTARNRFTRSFAATLALLPAIVCVVIMMVNGNIGAGVAVAGAFSLVRFRSAAGSAMEIAMIFLAMAAGLITGMGYIAYAFLFTIILCGCVLLFSSIDFGEKKKMTRFCTMHVTMPENLDYTGVFDDLFQTYTNDCELVSVKTTNMGSLFRLTYNLTLKDAASEKALIDQIRCRNGNLEISLSRQETTLEAL